MNDELHTLRLENEELRRKLGGGCDANEGEAHQAISQGTYHFCAKCGETLTGTRYSHARRAAPSPAAICDCERSHNGIGFGGRECDCGAPVVDAVKQGAAQ